MSATLLDSIDLSGLHLKNRVVMAPMTRARADAEGHVGPLHTTYYTQRATAGLIISEGINISPDALGSPFTPCLFTKEQVTA